MVKFFPYVYTRVYTVPLRDSSVPSNLGFLSASLVVFFLFNLVVSS